MKNILSAAILTALVAGPAAAQNREHQQMAADARMLQEQTQQLAITLAALNQALTESLKQINARLDQANETSRKAFAEQKVLIDNLDQVVRVIRNQSDDTNVRIGALREELEALRATVQAIQLAPPPAPIPVPVDPTDPTATASVPVPTQPPAPVAPPPSTAGLSPTRMFETAKADYSSGQYTLAITGFEQFLRAFPKSENSDDAQFYIGETYGAQNRWADAVAAYNLVIQNYPGANAVPDAYYKRGLAYERLSQSDAARASYETVMKSFPDSTAALLAKQSLDRLGRTQPR
jgi:tol-pal system protein YbgF